MRMPGFTAETSLYKTGAHYRATRPRGAMSAYAEVFPQQTTSTRLPEWMLRMKWVFPDLVCAERELRRDPSCIPDYDECKSECEDDWTIEIPGEPPRRLEPGYKACLKLKCELLCPELATGECLRWEWRPVVLPEPAPVWGRDPSCYRVDHPFKRCVDKCQQDDRGKSQFVCELECEDKCPSTLRA